MHPPGEARDGAASAAPAASSCALAESAAAATSGTLAADGAATASAETPVVLGISLNEIEELSSSSPAAMWFLSTALSFFLRCDISSAMCLFR